MQTQKEMITIKRTDADDPVFRNLVDALNLELRALDGDQYGFYAQFNKLDSIRHVVVAYDQDQPVGCGAIKAYSPDTMEIKRMFVPLPWREQGIATRVLKSLETWCLELNCTNCVLETGKRQPDAIALYKKNNYILIPNFGGYVHDKNSVCFKKELLLAAGQEARQ
jgi:GNAT superfamily N-acetyltransferase